MDFKITPASYFPGYPYHLAAAAAAAAALASSTVNKNIREQVF